MCHHQPISRENANYLHKLHKYIHMYEFRLEWHIRKYVHTYLRVVVGVLLDGIPPLHLPFHISVLLCQLPEGWAGGRDREADTLNMLYTARIHQSTPPTLRQACIHTHTHTHTHTLDVVSPKSLHILLLTLLPLLPAPTAAHTHTHTLSTQLNQAQRTHICTYLYT